MDAQTQSRQPHRVWPLYLIGLTLAAVGFYFAFQHTAMPAGGQVVVAGAAGDIDQVPADLDRTQKATLALKAAPRKARVVVEQTLTKKGGTGSTTVLTFLMHDAPTDGLTFERTYSDVRISTQEAGMVVGAEIPEHVAELISAVKHRVTFDTNGQVKHVELLSAQSGQLGPMLAMLKDATQMLAPQFPREAVNVDEPWSYRAPYEIGSEEGAVDIRGDFQVSSTYRGVTQGTLSVVEQNLTGTAKGVFQVEGKPAAFSSNGVGHAVFYVDANVGQVTRAGLVFDQVSAFGEGEGMQTSIRMTLEREP